jgi:hypothetical protein
MRRDELEHIIRAVGAIISDKDLIIVGSQSILGQYPYDLPPEATESVEADIMPLDDPDGRKGDLIEGAIGYLSQFWDTFGIWAHGIDEQALFLPKGWRDRLVPISNSNTWGVTGHCLDTHDLLIAKYVAGREKDLSFCRAVVQAGIVQKDILQQRLRDTECAHQVRIRVESLIAKHFSDQNKYHGVGEPQHQQRYYQPPNRDCEHSDERDHR